MKDKVMVGSLSVLTFFESIDNEKGNWKDVLTFFYVIAAVVISKLLAEECRLQFYYNNTELTSLQMKTID